MSDPEAEAASAAPESTTAPTSPPPVPRKGKGHIPEVKKPDDAEFERKLREGQDALSALFRRLNELNTQINEKTRGNSDFTNKRNILRAGLDDVQRELEALESDRGRIMTEMEEVARTGRDLRSRAQGLRRSLGFQSNSELDARIEDLERQRIAKRLSVHEENRIIQQIEHLRKSRPLMDQYANMEQDAEVHIRSAAGPLQLQLNAIKERLRVVQQRRRTLLSELSELNAARAEANAPLRVLSDEKDLIRKQIVEQRSQINQLRDERFRQQREYEAYEAKISRAQDEKKAEERRLRALDKEKEKLEQTLANMEAEAWSPEIQLLHQVVVYLKKLTERAVVVDDAKKTDGVLLLNGSDSPPPHPSSEGDGEVIILKPKSQRNDEYTIAPRNKKAVRKAKRAAVISSKQPLVHDIGTLCDFQKLGVAAPLTIEDCPPLLDSLDARLKESLQEQVKLQELNKSHRSELLARLEELNAMAPTSSTVHQQTAVKSY